MPTIATRTPTALMLALKMILLTVGCAAAVGCAGQPALTRYHYAELKMGVQANLIVYAPNEAAAQKACIAAYQRIDVLEQSMSDYRQGSELLRLCEHAGGPGVPVSDELFFVLQKGREMSEKTNGAFDVTVGPEVHLWRRARKSHQLPTTHELAAARARTGWRLMQLDPAQKSVRLDRKGMRLDLGGIGKGYAGDEAIRVLRENGINSALFEAGGDIVVSDAPPGKAGWVIQVDNAGNGPADLTVHDGAVSTSGDTVQFVEIGGVHYSHVVDPRTGMALTNHYAATIVAKCGVDSDALSTALCVMGPDGMPIVRQYHARGWIRKVEPQKQDH
jgi:thiamine biosynthesis lipoprotein